MNCSITPEVAAMHSGSGGLYMNKTTRISLGVAPRSLALLGVLALLLALVPFAGTAHAAHSEQKSGDGLVPSIRWAGENRFDTASKIAVSSTAMMMTLLLRRTRTRW